jgi:succinate-semialdehyde dehydrogenase/glutarate-semialdehyde dehydrogenase
MTPYPDIRLFIGGEWRSRPGRVVLNPLDDTAIGTAPDATAQDLADAMDAAREGLRIWRRTAPEQRRKVLFRAIELLAERTDRIARIVTLEQGKPLSQARAEVGRGIELLTWDAEECRRLYGRVMPDAADTLSFMMREPIGIVASFSTWNFPAAAACRKIAAAVAAGCSIILKASDETPGGAVAVTEVFRDAGLPDGVLNLVFGRSEPIAEYLVSQRDVAFVTCTGSVPFGRDVAALAGRHMKPAVMELGGHAPVIVCADADAAAVGTLSAVTKSRNAGQICVSPTRFFVAEEVHDAFVDAFVARAGTIRIGSGFDAETEMGPLANSRRVESLERLVADATAKGATLRLGGQRMGNTGCLFPMTVLTDVPADAEIMQEEPFGPIAAITRVGSVEEAISRANDIPLGLAGYLFTDSATAIGKVTDALAVGTLGINQFASAIPASPFGGVKDSGFGRVGGMEGLGNYTALKFVSQRPAL